MSQDDDHSRPPPLPPLPTSRQGRGSDDRFELHSQGWGTVASSQQTQQAFTTPTSSSSGPPPSSNLPTSSVPSTPNVLSADWNPFAGISEGSSSHHPSNPTGPQWLSPSNSSTTLSNDVRSGAWNPFAGLDTGSSSFNYPVSATGPQSSNPSTHSAGPTPPSFIDPQNSFVPSGGGHADRRSGPAHSTSRYPHQSSLALNPAIARLQRQSHAVPRAQTTQQSSFNPATVQGTLSAQRPPDRWLTALRERKEREDQKDDSEGEKEG